MLILFVFIFGANASAKDSTELAESRMKEDAKVSFFCPIGRDPILNSFEGLDVKPTARCSFDGPLDTKRDKLRLQPPILNPMLKLTTLKSFLLTQGANIISESSETFRFALPGSATLTAERVPYRQLSDNLFHLHAYPFYWGTEFTQITATREQDFGTFLNLAKAHTESEVFWKNPHYNEETKVLPRLGVGRRYLPVELLSKCQFGQDWGNFGSRTSMLFIGDMHRGEDAKFFVSALRSKPYAWVTLEFPRDHQGQLDRFFATADVGEEESLLSLMVSRTPKDVIAPFKDVLRVLKARKIKTFFMDYEESYFNFPYTSVAFHGLVIATRNLLWVNTLPPSWQGMGVIVSGLDHYMSVPGSDVQNFVQERYPGVDMALVNPLEKCQSIDQ